MVRNILTLLASLALTFLALEGVYRGYQAVTYGRPFFAGAAANGNDPTGAAVVGHPLLHYVPNPALPDVDENYFRTTGAPPSAAVRVVGLGGSTTFDSGVSAEDSYLLLLQQQLRRGGVDAQVVNGGAISYRLAHVTARYVHQVRQMLRPGDWLVIDVGYNDTLLYAGRVSPERAYGDFMKVMDAQPGFWRNFRILNWMRARLDAVLCLQAGEGWFDGHLNSAAFRGHCGPVPALSVDRAAAQRYLDNLRFLIRMAQQDGVRPILLIQDYNPALERTFVPVLEPMRRHFANVGRSAGAIVIDTRTYTGGRPALFVDQIHMNRQGNQLRAAAVAEAIGRERQAVSPSR
jgi:lysophospholipase L1-like esterase